MKDILCNYNCWMKDSCKKFNNGNCQDNEFCIKLFKVDELYNQALLPIEQRKKISLYLDSDGADREQYKFLKSVCDKPKDFVSSGSNLYIYSSTTGNGKTEWAKRILMSYIESIWYECNVECKALFINVPRFLLEMKANISNKSEYATHIFENACSCDLIVWDDICTKTATEFEHENLLSILDRRMALEKSNVFTSNIKPEELSSFIGDRLYSRIINFSTCVEFTGSDKRGVRKLDTMSVSK